ncbi:enoyl-CoA hydratase-related protein [Vannielia sp.]|uniref:enoyl-CoA hydratase-related protein n=1 Tax=Vannielia sp. TaxID=2813045 RepID=UPI002615E135|nr:enoyl-CoA hydratase-related protein [Vannielia sp.]MDF1871529.1 enoyl-CoA hydratase-related protein [Vannielia sp.]
MTYGRITYEMKDGVAVITLSYPEKMNSLDAQMRAELLHAIKAAEAEARVLVMTGQGRAFCAGQDLVEGQSIEDSDMERTLIDEYEPMLKAIYGCAIPTFSAVNGAAAGAGANLALAADVVIATESATFIQAFARIGLMPDAGGTWWLPKQVSFARAMGAALFADSITARQAEAWGMIWETVADDGFEAHWRGRAAHLAKGPTLAYRQMKQAIRASYENTLEEQLAVEAAGQGVCGSSTDFHEGVTAFLEKRAPRFEGR